MICASIRKRVKQRHLKALEIPHVSGDDRKLMHERAGCDHGVLVNRIRLPMHQFRPLPEGRGIHRQHIVGSGNLISPCLYGRCFHGILLTRDFYPGLDFAERHGAKMEFGISDAFEPRNHRSVWSDPAKLRDDIGIKKIHCAP